MNIEDFKNKYGPQKYDIPAFQKDLSSIFKELFQEFPEVKTFSWKQYRAYFNDGDVCNFYVRDYGHYVNGHDVEEQYEYFDGSEEVSASEYKTYQDFASKAMDYLQGIDIGLIEEAFGSDNEVTVSINDGVVSFETEHYGDHD